MVFEFVVGVLNFELHLLKQKECFNSFNNFTKFSYWDVLIFLRILLNNSVPVCEQKFNFLSGETKRHLILTQPTQLMAAKIVLSRCRKTRHQSLARVLSWTDFCTITRALCLSGVLNRFIRVVFSVKVNVLSFVDSDSISFAAMKYPWWTYSCCDIESQIVCQKLLICYLSIQ
jgi:hypothetical protein